MLIALHGNAQSSWQLIKDKKGIKIFTGSTNAAGFKRIKATAVFEGTTEQLIAIFLDVANQKNWVYATKQAYLFKKINDRELLYYVETSLPWPAKNRDAAIRMKIEENKTANKLVITTKGEPKAIPEKSGKVRVPHFIGTWEVQDTGSNKLSIDYFIDIDPGGGLPQWIVNMFIAKGPYETLDHLSQLLKK